ncbi:MAG TPA: hypothetical protein VF944_11035 [Candidatus Bathyarchaeia archaeon]
MQLLVTLVLGTGFLGLPPITASVPGLSPVRLGLDREKKEGVLESPLAQV